MFVDLTHLHIWWSLCIIRIVRLAKAKMGGGGLVKIEGKFHDRTTPECSEDRTAVPSVVKTESELYVCNFQLTFIQPMLLLVISFGLAHRLLSLSFIHLCTNLHTQH